MRYFFTTLLALFVFIPFSHAQVLDFDGNYTNGSRKVSEDGVSIRLSRAIFMNYAGAGRKGLYGSRGHILIEGSSHSGKISFSDFPVNIKSVFIASAIPPGGHKIALVGKLDGEIIVRRTAIVSEDYQKIDLSDWPKVQSLEIQPNHYSGVRVDRIVVEQKELNTWLGITDNVDGTANWNDSANWSMGIPKPSHHVVIPIVKSARYPIINYPVRLSSLNIQPGTRITLNNQLVIEKKGTGLEAISGYGSVSVREYVEYEDIDFGGIGLILNSDKGKKLGWTSVTRTYNHSPEEGLFKRSFLIKPQEKELLSAKLALFYEEGDAPIKERESMSLYAYDGSGWKIAGGSFDHEKNAMVLSGIKRFSNWSAGPHGLFSMNILRVRSFTNSSSLKLGWTIHTHSANKLFTLQTAEKNKDSELQYKDLFNIPGSGVKSNLRTYRTDVWNLKPGEHFFRVKEIDPSGRYVLTNELSVKVEKNEDIEFMCTTNGEGHQILVNLSLAYSQPLIIELVNEEGETVEKLYEGPAESGLVYELKTERNSLRSGNYVLSIEGSEFSKVLPVSID